MFPFWNNNYLGNQDIEETLETTFQSSIFLKLRRGKGSKLNSFYFDVYVNHYWYTILIAVSLQWEKKNKKNKQEHTNTSYSCLTLVILVLYSSLEVQHRLQWPCYPKIPLCFATNGFVFDIYLNKKNLLAIQRERKDFQYFTQVREFDFYPFHLSFHL